MYEDTGDIPEQFSDQSREAFAAATQELIAVLENYLEVSSAMDGTNEDLDRLLDMNNEIDEVVRHWNSSAFEHSGTSVLSIDDFDISDLESEDEPDEDVDDFASSADYESEDDSEEEPFASADAFAELNDSGDLADVDPEPAVESITIVSRWDLSVVDEEQLVAIAREVQQSSYANTAELDTDGTNNFGDSTIREDDLVSNAVEALSFINQDYGAPWANVDGIELQQATVVYVAPDETLVEEFDDLEDEPNDEFNFDDDSSESSFGSVTEDDNPFASESDETQDNFDDEDDEDLDAEDPTALAEIPPGEVLLTERWA